MSGPINGCFAPLGLALIVATGGLAYWWAKHLEKKKRAALAAEEARIDALMEMVNEAAANRAARRQATAERTAARELDDARRRYLSLAAELAELDDGTPAPPPADDAASLRAAAALLQRLAPLRQADAARQARAAATAGLLDSLASAGLADAGSADDAPGIAALLAAYARRKAPADRQARAGRLLASLREVGWSEFPARSEALFREFVATASAARADALEMSLQLELQALAEARRQCAADAEEAARLLAALPALDDPVVAAVAEALQEVSAGETALSDELREHVATLHRLVGMAVADLEQSAAATILESSLRDLGYAVEPIAHSLFAAGGTVHFQKPEWGDYFMRLRVTPDGRRVNFNMVRAGDAPTADRRREDARMENAWCSEQGFKRLAGTLARRGLGIEVQREIKAGELPVQTVAPDAIPAVLRQRARPRRAATPKARTLNRPEK